MELSPLIQGIIIGLTLAVPVGPISLLCIRRAVAEGRLQGIISGLGVTTADTFYALVAVLGLTFVSVFIVAHQLMFRAVAGFALIAIGIQVFRTFPSEHQAKDGGGSSSKNFLSMFAIAAANPMTLLFFLVVLPGFGIVIGQSSLVTSIEFVLGLFCGSATWWVVLSMAVGSLRTRLSCRNLQIINRVSGLLIVLFGIGMLALLMKG